MKPAPSWIAPLTWGLSALVMLLPVIAWGDRLNWKFDNISIVIVFPLLGLLAFSMMWAHFAVGVLKRKWPTAANYQRYYRTTGNLVLVLILLHPLLLYTKLLAAKTDAFKYVAPDNRVFIVFAYLALLSFLLYEIADRLRDKSFIKAWWPIIKGVNIAAFVLIYAHGLMLGQHLQSGWLRWVWIFYGVTGLAFIAHGIWYDLKKSPLKTT